MYCCTIVKIQTNSPSITNAVYELKKTTLVLESRKIHSLFFDRDLNSLNGIFGNANKTAFSNGEAFGYL